MMNKVLGLHVTNYKELGDAYEFKLYLNDTYIAYGHNPGNGAMLFFDEVKGKAALLDKAKAIAESTGVDSYEPLAAFVCGCLICGQTVKELVDMFNAPPPDEDAPFVGYVTN